jgi:type II secretory pathway pseudopilin PulG
MKKQEKHMMSLTGQTLVEIIITMVVIGIISIPLAFMVLEHIKGTVQLEEYTIAINLARLEIEKVNNMAWTSIIPADFLPYSGYNNSYDVRRSVSYVQGSNATPESLKQIIVTVTKHNSTRVLARLITYIARNVNYGL